MIHARPPSALTCLLTDLLSAFMETEPGETLPWVVSQDVV